MDTADRKLSGAIQKRNGRLTIIGQGYVGFPLAIAFAAAGFTVAGVDTDPDRVASLNLGRPPTPDVPAAALEALLADGHYRATTDFAVLEQSDVVIICVPTPLRKS